MNCDLFICIYVLSILAYQLPLVGCKLTDAVLALLQNKTSMDNYLILSNILSTRVKLHHVSVN